MLDGSYQPSAFAARKYIPDVKGLSTFKGDVYHTANWPQYGVNLKNRRAAVIGTGASGIQISQHTGPIASHLTIFQRTPNLCLPMNQAKLDPEEEKRKKASGEYEKTFKHTYETFAGFQFDSIDKKVFDDTPEAREAFFDKLFLEGGGFQFWLGSYSDIFQDAKGNEEAYKYWRKRVIARIPDPKKTSLARP